MRIAVVAPLVTPLAPVPTGGSQAFLVDLARGLKRRGHEVLVYCAAPSEVPGLDLVQVPVAAGLERALVAMKGRVVRGRRPLRRESRADEDRNQNRGRHARHR